MSQVDHDEIDSPPISADNLRRIQMTLQCPDAAMLPRVRGAGRVVEGKQGRYQLMHNGVKVVEGGYIGPWVTELIHRLKGLHEPQEERAFAEILKYVPNGATMVELGSWWAYYSLWFHRQIKNAHNYMIEPDPNNLQVGMRNFALNGMTGYHLNAAVGKESAASVLYRCYESDNLERPIPVFSVDDFIAREKIQLVDLLLADIQGAELNMLSGAEKSIAEGRIRFVVLSTHHHAISNDPLMHQKCRQFLVEHEAHLLAEHTIAESYSGDGLIVASFLPQDRLLPTIEISRNTARNSLFGELEVDLAKALEESHNWKTGFESQAEALKTRESENEWLQSSLDEAQIQLKQTREALETQHEFYERGGEEQRQSYENALKNAEAEQQRLDALLNAREQLVQGLQSMVAGLEADQQHLQEKLASAHKEAEAALTSLEQEFDARLKASEQESEATRRSMEQEFETTRTSMMREFESNRESLQKDLDANRHYVTLLERHVGSLEGEASGLRIAVRELRSSISWKLTTPIRLLHLRELARKFAFSIYRLLRLRPETSTVLTTIQRESPELWQVVAANVKPAEMPSVGAVAAPGLKASDSPSATPFDAVTLERAVAGSSLAVSPYLEPRTRPRLVVRVSADDKQHFLGLFERELGRRAGSKPESRQ